MNKPVDPTRMPHSPTETPLDLAAYAQREVVDEAVARGPQPRALGNLDFLARQQNQEEPKPGRLTGFFKRDKAKENTAAEEKPKKKGITRRELLGKGLLAAGAAYGVHRGVAWVNAPEDYTFALLHEDDQGHMELVHRQFATDETKGLIEPAKTSLDGLDGETVAANGLESLVVSPEITLRGLPRDRSPSEAELREYALHKHDPQEIQINGTPRNIYIPYHLFKDACRFNLSTHMEQEIAQPDGQPLKRGEREETINGERKKIVLHPKLRISIFGYPEAEDVPISQDISMGVTNTKDAAGDAATGLWNGITTLPDRLAEATGLGDGVNDAEVAAKKQAEAIRDREIAKPKPQVDPKFMIELDYDGDAKLPDLLFYNGQTLDAPSYRIPREDIATGIRKEPAANDIPGMHLITHNGMVSNYNEKGGVRQPQGVRYVDDKLREAVHAASTGDTSPEDGLLKDAWRGLKKITWEDNKLSKKESGALVMATQFQQNGLDKRLGDGVGGFANRFAHRVEGEPDQNVGR